MERLNEVRERYLEFMSSHVKGKSLDDSSALEVRPLKEFQFLERNLEELDHAHKKVKDRWLIKKTFSYHHLFREKNFIGSF